MSVTTMCAPSAASRRQIAEPMPAGGTGDQTHAARELAFGRHQAEFVLLERPIFDGVAFGVGERNETAQHFGAADHGDRAMVQFGGDLRVQRVLAGREHPDARE